ncbi:hypothetical protein K450DRAFT_238048 [Umbelopsis ramanniana AG]|uniref:N-acetyltransferase domain-containing protein n=1 Tax=Umbelopsis ramanniana AG TaxID=1314678 RepID=A0AAD5EBT7_UMBRA|nr:uncharacterized protein K450DRAFT_238048 [Umbelopsis ramanniana AG]KAI8580339.1 hypothetical protein K450DRAFT_238048 [Umbelopsis ramanniana AG]
MYEKDLGNGLLLRWVKPQDVEKIAKGMVDVFSPPDKRFEAIGGWFLRYANGMGGFMKSSDAVVIVDTKKEGQPVVGFTCYWQETHIFEGIPYTAEFVGVVPDPEYRGQRLQQHIMDALHARANDENHLVQVINGINWYYRQFGYEYALEFGERSKVWLNAIPELKEGEQEFIKYRRAVLDDIDTIQEIDMAQVKDGAVYIPLSKEWLATQINDHYQKVDNPKHVVLREVLILEDCDDNIVGYVVLPNLDAEMTEKGSLGVYSMGLIRGIDTKTALFSTMRQLIEFAKSAFKQESVSGIKSLAWYMSQWHPVVEAIPPTMRNFARLRFESLSYYVRVPDLAKFLQHILPALNRRLEQSLTHNNYTGVVKISNYTPRYPGVELKFEKGVIVDIAQYIKKDQSKDASVAFFPPHSFLQVLFGKRSIKELMSFLPDVYMELDVQEVLEVVFPKRESVLAHLM